MNLATVYLSKPSTQRILSQKPGQEGFSLIELVVVIAVLAVLVAVALPNFLGVQDDGVVAAGKKFLTDGVTECNIARMRGTANPTIRVPGINGGAWSTGAGTTITNNTTVACPTDSSAAGATLTFTPAVTANPIFNINLVTGAKTCSRAALFNCSAATNGTW